MNDTRKGRDEFGKRLKNEIRLLNLTQIAFAEKMKVSKNTVIRWIKGECNPKRKNLEKMAEIFNCSLDRLLSYF